MMKRLFSLRAPVIMAFLVALYLAGCHKDTEEEKIKNLIAGIQKAVREKDARTVLEYLSKTYHDPQGNNYEGIKGLLIFYFMKHRQVNAYVPSLDISIENNIARTTFQAVLTGAGGPSGSDAGILPEALGVYAFSVVLQKESGLWKITTATWERIGEAPVSGAGVSMNSPGPVLCAS